MLPIILVVLLFGGLIVVGGVVAAFTLLGPGTTPPPEPVPAPAPEPVPVAEPTPPPEPEAPAEVQVGFTSTPDEAEVWEGETLLCVTPCTVAHPDIAPLPRNFVLKRSGYLDTDYELADPSTPQHVVLRQRQVRPRPRPTQPPKPNIVLER